MTKGMDWNAEVHRMPKPMEVAQLARTHGYVSCCERWNYLHPRTVSNLIRAGKKQLERREGAAG
jgi:hypothetical protein